MTGTARAALWMAGAIASFTLLAVAGREVSGRFDTFEIMLYRAAMGVLIVTGVLAAAGRLGAARTDRLPLHGLRNVVHFTGQNLWFLALASLPLAQVFALEFTSPLWVLLLAPVVLGEKLTARGLVAGLLGFGGVLLVARPGAAALSPGLMAGAACAVFFALTSLITRRLTATDPVATILFWLNAMQLALAALAVAWRGALPLPQGVEIAWFLAIGVAGLSAHWCLTSALRAAPASVVMPLDFARLPVIAVVGWLLYNEAVGAAFFAGAALILGANLLTLRPQGRGLGADAA